MKNLFLFASAATVLAACSSMPTGQAAVIAEAAVQQPAPSAAEFFQMAGASDLYEIQSSQIVLQSTQDAALRRFAEMMVEHHTMTTTTLMAAARTDGMSPPPPVLDAAKAQMIAQLQAATGSARDALYKQQQMMAHREALALHARYAENGQSGALKAAARTAVPIVARHYNEITAMAGPS